VALLELLRHRSDLHLHIAHLDHETRAGTSADDASFVGGLAQQWKLNCTIARRSEIEPALAFLPANLSARYRAARLELFRRVIAVHQLEGVILAHHADDQAETVMQRLLRGSGPAGLTGMSRRTVVGEVTLLRPLLDVRRESLRQLLRDRGIAWREDASNVSPNQQRNRVRQLLERLPQLHERLIALSTACERLQCWLDANSPELPDEFELTRVRGLAAPLARQSLRRWLARHAGAEVDVTSEAVGRLMEMVNDAATTSRRHFPGGFLVRRRAGRIFVQR